MIGAIFIPQKIKRKSPWLDRNVRARHFILRLWTFIMQKNKKRKENNTMAEWAKEIMTLANDFCLNMAKAKEIVTEVENIKVPQGKDEGNYKYDRAWSRLKPMLLQ